MSRPIIAINQKYLPILPKSPIMTLMGNTISCIQCGEDVPGYYRGPIGHSPSNLCWCCWCQHWSEREITTLKGRSPDKLECMLYLLAHGYTQREISIIIGRARRTITRWIESVKRNPEKIPDWLANPEKIRKHVNHQKQRDNKKAA